MIILSIINGLFILVQFKFKFCSSIHVGTIHSSLVPGNIGNHKNYINLVLKVFKVFKVPTLQSSPSVSLVCFTNQGSLSMLIGHNKCFP